MSKKTLIVSFVMVTDIVILIAIWLFLPVAAHVRNILALILIANLALSYFVLSQKRQW